MVTRSSNNKTLGDTPKNNDQIGMMTLSLRNSLQLQQDVLCGPGKLAIAKSSAISVEG